MTPPDASALPPPPYGDGAVAPAPRPGVSRGVDLLRFVAIFFVMVIHVPNAGDFMTTDVGLNASFASTILYNGLGRIAAPLLGLISGYFCIAIFDRSGVGGFLNKKLTSLIYPLVLWNLSTFALLLGLNLASGGEHYGFVRDVTPAALIGLTAIPVNVPLHYLADLFKCCLVLTALWIAAHGLSLARPATGRLVLVAGAVFYVLITYANITGHPRVFRVNETDPRFLFRSDLAVFFFLGAALPLFGMRLGTIFDAATRRLDPAALAGMFVVLCGLAVLTLHGLDPVADAGLDLAKRFVGSVLLLALVARIAAGRLGVTVPRRVTFRAFCSHPLTYILLAPLCERLGLEAGADPMAAFVSALLFPLLAAALAWLSIGAQDRLAARLAPGRLRRLIEEIP